VRVSDAELDNRRKEEESKGKDAWKPVRDRKISTALKAYANMVTSADKGAVRVVE
jgi:dihydroxy-acid dehydratase